jgi:arogenate/prephenate dehydratase
MSRPDVRSVCDEGICVGLQDSSQGVVQQRVAYQGIPGAYSEGAALRACPGCEPLPCEQFELAFQALSQWLAERAVLPIQNSLGGSIHEVYDLLNRWEAGRNTEG